jgi:hypothetical protein
MTEGVDSQVVNETSVEVLAEAPAMALGSLYQTLANSIALASLNAVNAQQQMNMAQQSATAEGVALLLSIGKRR